MWHGVPTRCATGWPAVKLLPSLCAGFMTEGILAAYKFRSLDGGSRVQAILNHGWIQTAATISIGLGFLAIYRNKMLKGKVHYKSLHGKVHSTCGSPSQLNRSTNSSLIPCVATHKPFIFLCRWASSPSSSRLLPLCWASAALKS